MRNIAWAVAVALAVGPGAAEAQSWKTVTMSRQLESTDPVRVFVEYGAGRFTLGSAEERLLYRMSLRYDEDVFEPIAELAGDRLHLGVDSRGRSIKIGRRHQGGELELHLARGVPMDLDLEFGAVRAELDLGGLALTNLELSTGASESTIDVSEPNTVGMGHAHFEVGAAQFTANHLGNLNAESIEVDAGVGEVSLGLDGRWQQDAHVSIDMGLGSLELRIPEGLGIRLTKDSFLATLDSEGLVKRGEAYYSVDWDDADRKVTIELDAAFGSIKVVWIR